MSTTARLIGVRGYPRQALDWMASEHPGQPLATAAIADKLGIWLNDVHSTMFNLVAAGYMDKIADPADARRTLYAITAAGIEHSKLLSQLPAAAPVKLGAVHRRHKAKTLEAADVDAAADAAQADAGSSSGDSAPALTLPQALADATVVTLRQPQDERALTAWLTNEAQASADARPSTAETSDDGAADDAQPETRQHARLAHKMGRPLFAISPTGEVRVLLPRLGMSVYLQPETLHKLSAASALVRQAGGLA